MPNDTFADRVRVGDPLVGAWSMMGDPVAVEVIAQQEPDFVVLDGEHSENGIGDLADLVRAVDAVESATAPIIRAPSGDRAAIRRLLDLGPAGIVIPQLRSATAARAAVEATNYPPEGNRGVAGGRAAEYGETLSEYVYSANRSIATILQVETTGALADLEAIVAIDGVDALFVGPADLSAQLGVFGDFEAPAFRDALDRIVTVAEGAGVPVGTLATDPAQIETRRSDWGMDFLVTGTDIGYLREGMAQYRGAHADASDQL
jgi:2-dehydro-3-deoxyglucarate aldolase/4-hydroxy-2-oxoheptanedioate aldolase